MLKTRAGDVVGTQVSLVNHKQDDDGAFSVREFCDRYSIGLTAFYDEIKGGRLIVKKRGSRTLVPRANARAWFLSLPTMEPRSAA